jgi:hypothetical protein
MHEQKSTSIATIYIGCLRGNPYYLKNLSLERVLKYAELSNYMKKVSLELALGIALGLFLLGTFQVSAQPLTMDAPTGNLTDEVDISIDPAESLPANGTVTISTEGASDTDMNAFPPEGVSVIISGDTVTVTNQSVDVGTSEDENGETESVGDFNEIMMGLNQWVDLMMIRQEEMTEPTAGGNISSFSDE